MTNDPGDKTFHPSRRGFLGVAAATGAASLAPGVLVLTTATTAALAEASEPASSQSVDAFASAIAAKLPSPVPGYLSFGPDKAGFVEVPQELIVALESPEPAGALADLAASFMDIKPKEKQEILESVDLVARIDKVARLLSERIEVLRLSNEIGLQTKATFDERQRKAVLSQQMATIQRELGEGDGKAQEVAELAEAIAKANMPEEAERQALKELRRYERMPEGAAEAKEELA